MPFDWSGLPTSPEALGLVERRSHVLARVLWGVHRAFVRAQWMVSRSLCRAS